MHCQVCKRTIQAETDAAAKKKQLHWKSLLCEPRNTTPIFTKYFLCSPFLASVCHLFIQIKKKIKLIVQIERETNEKEGGK